MLPHLSEAEQDSWLAELQRLTRPGALLLLSVQGLTHMALYRAHGASWKPTAPAGMIWPAMPGWTAHAPAARCAACAGYILAHWGGILTCWTLWRRWPAIRMWWCCAARRRQKNMATRLYQEVS